MSLIEAMIALVILSVMMLGVSAMQELTLRTAVNTDHRTQAERLAYEFVQYYELYTVGGAPSTIIDTFAIDDTGSAFGGNCDRNVMAGEVGVDAVRLNFLNCWRARVRDTLPAGRFRSSHPSGDSSTSPTIVVEILWGRGGALQQVRLLGG